MPLVPTNRPKSEQPQSRRDGAWIASIGAGATTIGTTAALTALVGWPGLVLGIALGLIGRAAAGVERIAAARQAWAKAKCAAAQARADAGVAAATADADIAQQELRAQRYRRQAEQLIDPSGPAAGLSSLSPAAGTPAPSVASVSAHPEDLAQHADDPATFAPSR